MKHDNDFPLVFKNMTFVYTVEFPMLEQYTLYMRTRKNYQGVQYLEGESMILEVEHPWNMKSFSETSYRWNI